MPSPISIATPTSPQGPGGNWGDFAKRIADQALGEARREVQSQIDAARTERQSLQSALDGAPSGSVRRDLQNQIRETDLKIEKLEEALSKIGGKTTTNLPGQGQNFPGTTPPPSFPGRNGNNFDPTDIVAISMGILFVAFPLTLAIVRFIWKRSTNAPPAAFSQEQARRFDRLEQSVDSIAIEIERISESQRYLTKLLAEPKQAAKISG